MRLRWTRPAAEDLYNITRFIRRDDPTTAREVAKPGCTTLASFPYRGRKGRKEGTRELVFPGLSYIVVYRIKDDTAELARIYHGAQDG
jgi:toxin ParE1/3/4